MKPIIGITASTVDEECSKVLHTYVSAIEDSGGIPLLLPRVTDEETLDTYLSLLDGIFFTGGADLAPDLYGETAHYASGPFQLLRDAYEMPLAKKALETDLPILAVCRGAQLINVALGGTLWQDIPSAFESNIPHRQSEPKTSPSHSVTVVEDSPLYALTGKCEMTANSFHHQALKVLGCGLSVMACAADGIIEAVYAADRPYLRAYQWHPERLYKIDADNCRIFTDFIETARRNAK